MATRDRFPGLVEGDGMKGGASPGVLAAKYLSRQVLAERNQRRGLTRQPLSPLTGRWDNEFTRDLVVVKQYAVLRDKYGRINPHVIGRPAWDYLWTFARGQIGGRVNDLVAEELRRRDAAAAAVKAAAVAAASGSATRTRLVKIAEQFLGLANLYVYAQIRPFPLSLFDPVNRRRYDCSSTVIAMYHVAGAPMDPSGYRWQGWGDTGALWARGTRVTSPLPGDLAFYGWETRNGRPQHVAMHLGGGDVVTFGSTPPRRRPVYYRSDYIGSRSYL